MRLGSSGFGACGLELSGLFGVGSFYLNGGITMGINNLCYMMFLGQSASVFRLVTARTSNPWSELVSMARGFHPRT